MIEITASLKTIDKVVDKIVKLYDRHLVILLRGNLAFGKTTLARHIIRRYSDKQVTSPTFSKMVTYENNIFHYDMYQISLDKFIAMGLFENLDLDGLHIIEWGDEKLQKLLLKYLINHIVVDISKQDDKKRIYKIYA